MFDHADVRAIIDEVFQINARLGDIVDHLAAIRFLLGEDNGEEEQS